MNETEANEVQIETTELVPVASDRHVICRSCNRPTSVLRIDAARICPDCLCRECEQAIVHELMRGTAFGFGFDVEVARA